MASLQVNFGVLSAYLFLAFAIGLVCGYLAGKIAQSASLSFGVFFVIGILFNLLGILIAAVARSLKKRGGRKRQMSVLETQSSVEARSYYQPDYLQLVSNQAPMPSPSPRQVDFEGMGKCGTCYADNPRDSEFCWKCGELVG